jgi:hypothetical protein
VLFTVLEVSMFMERATMSMPAADPVSWVKIQNLTVFYFPCLEQDAGACLSSVIIYIFLLFYFINYYLFSFFKHIVTCCLEGRVI